MYDIKKIKVRIFVRTRKTILECVTEYRTDPD